MAIDTAPKRKSCIGLALLFLGTGIIPDGSNLSASERLHTDGLYSGIASGAPATVNPVTHQCNLNINTADTFNLYVQSTHTANLNIETALSINLEV